MRRTRAGRSGWRRLHRRLLRRVRHSDWLRQVTRPRAAAAALGAAGVIWFVAFSADVIRQLPAASEIDTLGDMANATVVYDADDQPVFTLFRERRLSVPLTEISSHLIDAIIAIEDRRFDEHRGFDLIRIGGAAVANLTEGRLAQGASTITQQLARVSLLSTDRTFRRKLAEVITAIQIERLYSKDRILTLYLNKVYFGDGHYGVEAAAQGYFGKRSADLTLGEAALLAGLVQAPSRYSPVDHPEEALRRRELVLAAMLDSKVAHPYDVALARHEPLVLSDRLDAPGGFGAYFKAEVQRRVLEWFGPEAVYGEGLHVYTTIDPTLQRAAEEAVAAGLARIEAQPRYPHPTPGSANAPEPMPDPLQAALLALDTTTGAVRAVVGGRRFADSPFNRATQAHRQPGSAFKPFLYAAAVEHGITTTTRLDELDRPTLTVEGEWLPHDETDADALNLRQALRVSSNRAAVRLLELTGIERVVDYAGRFALEPPPPVPALALGAGTVTLESLTAAYAAFANQGIVPRPAYIRRVERADGTVVYDTADQPPGRRAVTPATAFIVGDLLRDVVDAGTGARVRREGFAAPAGGKTGTTDEYKDAWFVGFTPELTAGVWIGFDQPSTIMPSGYASDLAAPVWAGFMRTAADASGGWIERPPDVVTVEICALSGARARDGCQRSLRAGSGLDSTTYAEHFVRGTEPSELCAIHGRRNIFGVFAALFQRGGPEIDDATLVDRTTDTEPAVVAERAATDLSLAVVHDHVFGSCNGLLIADDQGLRYKTTHKDAFRISYAELERFELDRDDQTLRVRPRRGRRFNFTPLEQATVDNLSAFHTAVDDVRVATSSPVAP